MLPPKSVLAMLRRQPAALTGATRRTRRQRRSPSQADCPTDGCRHAIGSLIPRLGREYVRCCRFAVYANVLQAFTPSPQYRSQMREHEGRSIPLRIEHAATRTLPCDMIRMGLTTTYRWISRLYSACEPIQNQVILVSSITPSARQPRPTRTE